MSEPPLCPRCKAPLPDDAPAGLCPKCLVQAGFESEAGPAQSAGCNDPAVQPTLKSPLGAKGGFEPPLPEELGPLFPQLEILELLGKGGMGAVYKARQRGLDRLVAVKILPPEIGNDASFAERFTREARALARLNHPHIVAVYDFGQTDGLFYIVMEYVDGANLRQTIQASGLTSRQALAIVPQICEALQFAHDEGIVHRDIKPENILIDKRGRVKIADFGLAKLLGADAGDHSLTGTHQVMGTLRYMAPEQMQGTREVDHRADIYSLGVVFYELLTGDVPVGRFAPPSKKVEIDVRLDEVVLRALEREPEQRYQHASEVKTAIERMSFPSPMAPGSSSHRTVGIPPEMLSRVLATAICGMFGGLSMAAGIALASFVVFSASLPTDQFWNWMGGAFGCLFGGGGALIGAINSYRQLDGAGDLMTAHGRNWLDRVVGGYALLGGAAIAAALGWTSPGAAARYSLLLLGTIVVGQAVLFWVLRSPYRRQSSTVEHSHAPAAGRGERGSD